MPSASRCLTNGRPPALPEKPPEASLTLALAVDCAQTVVDDYTAHKSMLINITNGVETCDNYCPIDPDETLEKLDP